MASANFDSLHLKLSRKIFDPVAAAATDGVKVSSLLRTDYLNRANRFIQRLVWVTGKAGDFLGGLITSVEITFSSSGVSVASDYSFPVALRKALSHPFVYRPPSQKAALDGNYDPNEKTVFTVMGGKVYAYENGAILTSGTGYFFYLKSDQRASSGDSEDIAIDSLWYDTLVDIASSYYFEDRGEVKFAEADKQRELWVLSIVGK